MSQKNNPLKNPIVLIALGLIAGAGALAFSLGDSNSVAHSLTRRILPTAVVSQPVANVPAPELTKKGLDLLRDLDQTFAGLAEEASAGVVSIQAGNGMGQGQGSGFVYRKDGWIVTNDHVVAGNEEVTVILNDGREIKGKVTRANDNQIDLAVIKIDADGLIPLPMADSNRVHPGQFAMAVGAPFGLDNTVTVGHVSAISRGSTVNDPRYGERGYAGLIQTDAPINPGNSGGPLLNIEGEVIGVNSTIVSTTAASAGIGFSIPSNIVSAVADELIATGKFDRGFLGAVLRDVKPYEREKLGVKGGAMLDEVPAEGPAGKAGLKDGDVLVQIGNEAVATELDLRILLYKTSPNQSVPIQFIRDGQTKTASLKLGAPEAMVARRPESFPFNMEDVPGIEIPDELRERFNDPDVAPVPDRVRLGVGLRMLDETARSQFKLPASAKGVVIMTVTPNSFAQRVGMRTGDVLVRLNGEDIVDVDDVSAILADVQWGDQVTVVMDRYTDGVKSTITQTRAIR